MTNCTRRAKCGKSAFTLVELMVVIAIVSLLVALLLPATLAAREAARSTVCRNNLKQLSLGLLAYADIYETFPPGGWGQAWVGAADFGVGPNQPGGWAYSILPLIEEGTIYELDRNAIGAQAELLRRDRLATPIAAFVCPSRRAVKAWPTALYFINSPSIPREYLRAPRPAAPVDRVARSDYAINLGTSFVFSTMGPESVFDAESFGWQTPYRFDGISHLRIGATRRTFVDGFSKTYLVGEKFVDIDHYHDGLALGDNETLYSGFCSDLHRSSRRDLLPLRDQSVDMSLLPDWRFGSAHPAAFHMAMADGSVEAISYDIESEVHHERGTRRPSWTRPSRRF